MTVTVVVLEQPRMGRQSIRGQSRPAVGWARPSLPVGRRLGVLLVAHRLALNANSTPRSGSSMGIWLTGLGAVAVS